VTCVAQYFPDSIVPPIVAVFGGIEPALYSTAISVASSASYILHGGDERIR
jgi:hypothetical protein